jgi:hypothetical protein
LELAPFPDKIGIGCQGFIGPLPSAFLDKCPDNYRDLKNWYKGKGENFEPPNKKLKYGK